MIENMMIQSICLFEETMEPPVDYETLAARKARKARKPRPGTEPPYVPKSKNSRFYSNSGLGPGGADRYNPLLVRPRPRDKPRPMLKFKIKRRIP